MQIPEGFAQVNLEFTGAAVPRGAQVVFGVEATAATAISVATDVGSAVSSSSLMSSFVSTCVLTNIHVKLGPNDTGNFFDDATSLPGLWAAGEAGAVAPAVLVRKATAIGGRAGRGRSYWPGVPESVVGPGGVLVGTYVTDTQTRMDAFLTALNTNGVPMVLLHAEPPTIPFYVTSYQVDATVATQRRRQRR